MSNAAYKLDFLGRVAAARTLRFELQEDAAAALGMTQGKYKQYESRSLMPHSLIEQFCAITGVSIPWLLTGKGPGPKWAAYEPSHLRRTKAKGRKAA